MPDGAKTERGVFGMSENTEGTAIAGEENGSSEEFKAPATQADLDRIIQDRVARERNKYADYDEVKSKAEEFHSRIGELEAQNGELVGKVTTFETERDHAQIIARVAKAEGLPASALRGNTEEEVTAHAASLKEAFKPSAPVIPGQAKTPGNLLADPNREAVKKLFGNN